MIRGVLYPYEDVQVIKANVISRKFNRYLLAQEGRYIFFQVQPDEMGIMDLKLEHTNTFLKGFKGGRLTPLGVVELPMTI